MSSFKNSVTCLIIDIGARSDTDTAHHGSQLVGNVITVQVQCGNDRVFFGNKQRILQKGISYTIFDNKTPVLYFFAKFTFRHFVPPFLETAFGELHNVAFVHQCHRRQIIFECVQASCAYQPLRSFFRHRFYTKRRSFGKTYFSHTHFIMQETVELVGFRCSGFPFDTCINIFRILTKYTHIYLLRFFHRRDYAFIPTHRTQTNIQIERLA